MTGSYATAITVIALMLAVWTLVLVAMNRSPGLSLLAAASVLEALLVGFLIGGIVQMVGSDHHFARAEFVGYLLACLAIPPMAVAWAREERSRSGTLVIAFAFLLTPVMVLRVQQVWTGPLV
jgi:succinate-acetate transporter protein